MSERAAKTVSTYAKVQESRRATSSAGRALQMAGGALLTGAGAVVATANPLLGIGMMMVGADQARLGYKGGAELLQRKVQIKAIDALIAKSQGQPAIAVARNAAAGARSDMGTSQHPALPHTGAVAPPVSDGMVDPYTRVVNGKTISVGGYKR